MLYDWLQLRGTRICHRDGDAGANIDSRIGEIHTFSEYVNRKKVKLAARAKTQPKAGAKVNAQMKTDVKAKAQPKQNPVLPH